MKTLTLVAAGLTYSDRTKLAQHEAEDKSPRVLLYQQVLNSDILDEHYLARAPRIRRLFYRMLPVWLAQVAEAYIVRRRYDAIISWNERLGLPMAALFKLTRTRYPHVGMFGWFSKPKKAEVLRRVHSHIDRIITWNSVQRSVAENKLGIPPSKIAMTHLFVDQHFFRPMSGACDMICSVGSEMRDFPTLIEALRGLEIPCHIAAGTTRRGVGPSVRALYDTGTLPQNITVGRKTYGELRELYARSRFVVIPLLPSDTDNGISVMLEAMAMNRPVICSRTQGQVDVLEHGRTGLYVPPGDPRALREAILWLWGRMDECERMGGEARKYVEEHATMDKFVHDVKSVVEEVIQQYGKTRV